MHNNRFDRPVSCSRGRTNKIYNIKGHPPPTWFQRNHSLLTLIFLVLFLTLLMERVLLLACNLFSSLMLYFPRIQQQNKKIKRRNANSVAKASAHWGSPGSRVFDRIWRISAFSSLIVALKLTFTMCGKKKNLFLCSMFLTLYICMWTLLVMVHTIWERCYA